MYEELYKRAGSDGEAVERLIRIIEVLRSPGGCPWDREQTHESLKRPMLEEACEAIEAIEQGDDENLVEELGDVLLQVVLNAQIGVETGRFSITDIANGECDKMLRRHPHVFAKNVEKCGKEGDISVDTVLDIWENVKRIEKKPELRSEAMKSIPRSLPALLRSEKIQRKAAKAGFDWDDVSGAFEKIEEETAELREAAESGSKVRARDELGDLLFAVVNAARFLDIDPEEALNSASSKFIRRFSSMEEQAAEAGKELSEMSLYEMDQLWTRAKRSESKL